MKNSKKNLSVAILILCFNQCTVRGTSTQPVECNIFFIDKCIELDIESLQVKTLSFVDSTNFDNFSFADTLNQAQIQKLKLDERFDYICFSHFLNYNICTFYLNYRIELSENFTSLVVSYTRGDFELFTILINYDKDFRIIDILHIAYDEVADSRSRRLSAINTDKIIVKELDFTYYADGRTKTETFVYKIDAEGRFLKYWSNYTDYQSKNRC